MIFSFLWNPTKTKINASICKAQHDKKSKGGWCAHRVCFCISPPGSTPGFALPLSGLGCQLTCGKITPKSLKNPGLDPGSPLCCVCRIKVAAVLLLPGAGGGQVRTARAGAFFSKWLHSLGERTAKLPHVFILIPVSLQEDQHMLPKVLPLTIFALCLQSPVKQWAPSQSTATLCYLGPDTPCTPAGESQHRPRHPVGCWAAKPTGPLWVPLSESPADIPQLIRALQPAQGEGNKVGSLFEDTGFVNLHLWIMNKCNCNCIFTLCWRTRTISNLEWDVVFKTEYIYKQGL